MIPHRQCPRPQSGALESQAPFEARCPDLVTQPVKNVSQAVRTWSVRVARCAMVVSSHPRVSHGPAPPAANLCRRTEECACVPPSGQCGCLGHETNRTPVITADQHSFKSLANSTASRRRTAAIGVSSAAATPASNNTTPMSRNGVVGSAAMINGSITTQSGSGVVGSGGSGETGWRGTPAEETQVRQCARATRRSLLFGERRDSTDTGSLIVTGRITVLGGTDASATQGSQYN